MYVPLVVFNVILLFIGDTWAHCPCSNSTFCEPVTANKKHEVFGYVTSSKPDLWKTFSWDKLTTISLIDFYNNELMCLAHQHNVRVMLQETFTLTIVENETLALNWIKEKLQFAKENFLDGINLFIDDPIEANSATITKLNNFVKSVTEQFHNSLNQSLVVFNFPWSAYNEQKLAVDGKNYDFLTISKIVDKVIVMNYDQRSQTYDTPCEAGPGSNYFYTVGALEAYKEMSIDLGKLVLGIPYYADDYVCTSYEQNMRCYVRPLSYRGSKCSSRNATRIPLNEMSAILSKKKVTVFYDEHSTLEIGMYLEQMYGRMHQIWMESASSLSMKFILIDQFQLGGLGMYTLNFMDKDMWKDIPKYKDFI